MGRKLTGAPGLGPVFASVLLLACVPGCGRGPAQGRSGGEDSTSAFSVRFPRVHLFPAGAETLRVEIHYLGVAPSPATAPPANGVTVTLGRGRPLTLQGDLDSQEWWSCVDSLSGRDLNGDGAVEAVLARSNGGGCATCRSVMVVSVLRGAPRVISPDAEPDLVPVELRRLSGDTRYQLLMLDNTWEEAHGFTAADSPRPLRVWAWNGRAYADSTPAYRGFVRARMHAARDEACSLEGSSLEGRWLGRLAEYVLGAESIGEGRAALDTLRAHVAAHPPVTPGLAATATEVEVALANRLRRRTP